MSILSIASHNRAKQELQKQTNELIFKCVSYACQQTTDLRSVLIGDKSDKILTYKVKKVS